MVRRRTTEREGFRKEEDLLVFARSYLSDAFPNPERTGCPADDALRLMALRPVDSDASLSEHLMCCSPCFNAYVGHLAEVRAKARQTAWIKRSAVAFGIAAVLAIAGYLFLANHRSAPIIAPRNQAPTIAPEKPVQTQATAIYVPVLIDLSNASPTRGSKPSTSRSVPQIIPAHSPVALNLRLPLGSEERRYLITLTSGQRVVWSESSEARRENGDTLLHVNANFKDLSTGSYQLQVSSDSEKLSVPVVIRSAPPNRTEQQH
jgi:hypothetical protein